MEKKQNPPKKDIKRFIDFFCEASVRIRKQKPTITRGKDGVLVERALIFFSRQQLEMLAVWFLVKKQKLSPAIGTMLSRVVLEELSQQMRRVTFWKELDMISERYFPRSIDSLPITQRSYKVFSSRNMYKLKKNLFS